MPAAGRQRVGVITIHHVPNYGAFLQAWALAAAIRQLGHSVEIIDYRPAAAVEFYRRRNANSRFRALKSFAAWRSGLFMAKRLPLSPRCESADDLRSVAGRYDAVVCGSDQVWHTKTFRGFDDAFFLSFVESDATKRVAYAPSCSGLDSFAPHEERVRSLLSRFDALTGRDTNTIELVRGLGVQAIERVVDPTLLVDFDTLERPPGVDRPYLLLYGRLPVWSFEPIKRFARQRDLKIISALTLSPIADRSYPFVLPGRWIGFFRGATAVITSAFHGVMFSLKFHRPFLAIPASGKSAKIRDALSALRLEERVLEDASRLDEHPMDETAFREYETQEALEPLIAGSLGYLRRALDG